MIDYEVPDQFVYCLGVLPDGKLLTSTEPGVLRRFNGDGTVDSTFGAAGKMDLHPFYAYDMSLDPANKVVIAGASNFVDGTSNGSAGGIKRYYYDGTNDIKFADHGTALLKLSPKYLTFYRLLTLSNGKLLIYGESVSSDFLIYNRVVTRFYGRRKP